MNVTDSLHKAVISAMELETRRIVEEEAKKAANLVEARVREMAGYIATRMASQVSYETGFGGNVITVRILKGDAQ